MIVSLVSFSSSVESNEISLFATNELTGLKVHFGVNEAQIDINEQAKTVKPFVISTMYFCWVCITAVCKCVMCVCVCVTST